MAHLLLRRARPLFSNNKNVPSKPLFALESLALLAAAATVTFSRVYLGYHSREQIAVGAALGACAAAATSAAVLAVNGNGKKNNSNSKSKKR